MSGRPLPEGRSRFDDILIGDWLQTGTTEITADMLDAFAEMTGDRFEIHMSDEAARAKGFAGRVAHGLLVLSLIDGLKNQSPAQFDAIASLGWDWRFSRPILIGDMISARIEVIGKRVSHRAGRGTLTLDVSATNQIGEIVQEGINWLMVHR
ncbi:MAG: (R)-hydratase [Boseongicola sp.]|nr:MAG: (R)-hydratase [Boseongicola sp.]